MRSFLLVMATACFFHGSGNAAPRQEASDQGRQVGFCLRLSGVEESKAAELLKQLQQLFHSLGWRAEAMGAGGRCCTGENCPKRQPAGTAATILEIELLRIGPMLTVTVRGRTAGEGKICERKKTLSGMSEAKVVEAAREEFLACLPAAVKAERPALGPKAAPAPAPPPPVNKNAGPLAAGDGLSAPSLSGAVSASAQAAPVSSYRAWGHALFWSGLALEIGGVVSMVLAQKEYDRVNQDLSGDPARVKALGGLGIAAAVLGGLGMAGGVVLWLLPGETARVAPLAGAEGFGLVFQARW